MRGRRPSLVTIGDLTMDVVVSPAGEAESGTDVPATIRFRAGGSAANTARAFASLGGAASFIGAVGTDRLARLLRAALRAEGLTLHLVETPGRTARLIVSLSAGGERSFLTDRGVADSLAPGSLRPEWLARADALHLPAYSLLNAPLADASLAAARTARQAAALVAVDLASWRPLLADGPAAARATIEAVAADVLFANHEEASALVGAHSSRRLLELAPVVVIKAGAAGCTVLWAKGQIVVRARPFKTTDTTGAGDAFDAGFLWSLIPGWRGVESVRATDLRRAAGAGQKAAKLFLRAPRQELDL